MPNGNIPEDPIEAIKRRNEERAARLREKLAAEGGAFETSINGTVETRATDAEEFDLGSFPPPPEPEFVPVGRDFPVGGEILEPPPPAGATGPEISDIELPPPPGVETPAGAPELDIEVIRPPDIAEIPVGPEVAAKIIDIDMGEEAEFPVPEAWNGFEAPEVTAVEEPAVLDPAVGRPVAEERLEVPTFEEEPEIPVIEGLELPEFPRIEVPTGEIIEAVKAPPESFPPVELPEIPVIIEEEPEIVPVEAEAEAVEEVVVAPEPVGVGRVAAEEPLATEPVVAEPAEEELIIRVSIEVSGTRVRITRENIALEGAVELFRKILDRYESR